MILYTNKTLLNVIKEKQFKLYVLLKQVLLLIN